MDKNSNVKSYNKIANEWDKIRSCKIVDNCIIDFCKLLPKNASILDIGCGTGKPIAEYCYSQGFNVTGIDPSIEMIKKASSYIPNAKFINKDLFSFESDQLFDGIIGFDSLWHISHDSQHLIYPKVSSLLKPNGYFIFTAGLTDGVVEGKMFESEFGYAALDKNVIKKLLDENSFKIIKFEENYEHPTTGTRDLLVLAKKHS